MPNVFKDEYQNYDNLLTEATVKYTTGTETLQKGNSGQMWTEELVYPFDDFEEEYED